MSIRKYQMTKLISSTIISPFSIEEYPIFVGRNSSQNYNNFNFPFFFLFEIDVIDYYLFLISFS